VDAVLITDAAHMKNAYIGTSGFSYAHWKGNFYPAELATAKQLEFYTTHFNTVEINSSFYHLPKQKTFESWLTRTPDDFRFVIKGSRYITQFLSLANTEEAVEKFFEPAAALKHKLEMVLWQLPPRLKADDERLENFIRVLKKNKVAKKKRHAFEFRHASWFTESIYEVLKKHNYGFVIAHSNRWPSAEAVTADFIYLRFHGAPQLFYSNYTDEELAAWGEKAKKWARGRDVFGYFNNDAGGFATKNAETLRNFLRKPAR
jgi:uncharacterized protein YecE (DUF72 family)